MSKKTQAQILAFFLTLSIVIWFVNCSNDEKFMEATMEIEGSDKASTVEVEMLSRELLELEFDLSYIKQQIAVPITFDTKVFSQDGKLEFSLWNENGEIIAQDLVSYLDEPIITFRADKPWKIIFICQDASIKALTVGSNIDIDSINPDPTNVGNGVEVIYSVENEDAKIVTEIKEQNEIIWTSSEGEKGLGEWSVSWEGKDKDGKVVGEGTYFFIIRDDKSSEDMKDFDIK